MPDWNIEFLSIVKCSFKIIARGCFQQEAHIRGEEVILLGDFNKQIGSDYLGIEGNKQIISYGGQLVRDLLASENYVLVNNTKMSSGGPWTREDP